MPITGFCNKVSLRQKKIPSFTGNQEVEFILETSGTDLKKVLTLPYIDKSRTTTNDIWDIYRNLGIEATRLAIMREIRIVFNFFNIYVNYRHIALLTDTITNNGKMMAISRNGINRVYQSPFRKCSFEETVDILINAAVFADVDSIKGVTESVMLG